MLAKNALKHLESSLLAAIDSTGVMLPGSFGRPELVLEAARKIEKTFQVPPSPPEHLAYDAALAFLRGKPLDSWERHLIASVLCMPVKEYKGEMALASHRFASLLEEYEKEAEKGALWRLTWHGMLCSYFSYDPGVKNEIARQGWGNLRTFLERSWRCIDRDAGQSVPEWVKVLRSETNILSKDPTLKYAEDYLAGNKAPAERIARGLGIPPSSWFWQHLVMSAVNYAGNTDDARFREYIPRLISLVKDMSVFRDQAISNVLERYCNCKDISVNVPLRDYAIEIWKSPNLKNAGIAPAWNQVSDEAWRMVCSWVNESNLREFFAILASRNQTDEGRLTFWSRYMKQIVWTRLVFSQQTVLLKNDNREIRDLIAREKDAYAKMTRNNSDAFMMQIGRYIIVEFSLTGNAAYVYEADSLPFGRDTPFYTGTTDDLRAGFRGAHVARILHNGNWEETAARELEKCGIFPDKSSSTPPSRTTAPSSHPWSYPGTSSSALPSRAAAPSGVVIPLDKSKSSSFSPDIRAEASDEVFQMPGKRRFTMKELQDLVGRYREIAAINDNRKKGGRLWVDLHRIASPDAGHPLNKCLRDWGFEWTDKRFSWYLPAHQRYWK